MEAVVIDCPFKPLTSIEWMPRMRLPQVIEIEKHISTSSCHHPPLKDLVYHGAIDGIYHLYYSLVITVVSKPSNSSWNVGE